MGHSLWRISFVIALSISLHLHAVQPLMSVDKPRVQEHTLQPAIPRPSTQQPGSASDYSVKDMHELLWFSVRQNPYVVEAIHTRELVLLPPREGLDITIPEGIRAKTIIFPTLIDQQWFAVVIEFHLQKGRLVEDLTIYETTGHLNKGTRRRLREHEFTLQHPMLDPDKAASGTIIAQLILRFLGAAKSFGSVENMRWQHLSFLRRRRELMTTMMDVRVLERNNTEVQNDEDDNVVANLVTTRSLVIPAAH